MARDARCRVVMYGPIGLFFVIAVAVAVVWTPQTVSGKIRWRSGPAEITLMTPAKLADRVTELAGRPNERHVVVKFNRSLGPAQRKQVRKAGLNVLRYVGNRAFFASLSRKNVDASALGAMPYIEGLWSIEPAWKLDPRIAAREVPRWAVVGEDPSRADIVAVYVLFHPDIPLSTEAIHVVTRHGAVVLDELESINGLVVELPVASILPLADEDAVQWIEWPLPRMTEINDSSRAITEANTVQAAPYGLDGSGVTVLVYDVGYARSTHVDFQGRLTIGDMSAFSDHATHVCCTVGGAGVSNPVYKGMAPNVTLASYGLEYDDEGIFLYSNPGDMETDYSEAISVYGADISNNSIGTNTEINGFDCDIQGNYGVTSQLIDTVVRGDGSNPLFTEPFRVVWANGNERQGSRCNVEGYGDYYSTAPPAGAKNHISVGALNSNDDSMTSFSSWGPVDDGRLKPDVSAPGCQSSGDGGVTSCSSTTNYGYTTKCGTSMASPTVCGLSALLLQDFRVRFPDRPDFRNSTLKALLAHNAEDVFNKGPDYQSGYGSVRIQRTVDFMRTGSFLEDQVDQGETFSILVQVDGDESELKVTLAWDDFPGTPNVIPALVNDLDLRVFDPFSQQYYPWTLDPNNPSAPAVRTQPDHVNNIEQVFVENPTPGVWRVEVSGYEVPQGPQSFSLCASPQLTPCASQGIIALDASKYGCTATAEIQVVDCDLNTDDGTIETVTLTVSSDSEPNGKTVSLTETGVQSAEFRGTIPLDTEEGAGVLWVHEGDTVTATYTDADDGQGGQGMPVTDTATVDCTPPLITNVQSTDTEPHNATVTFDTDEPAKGTVRYGLTCDGLAEAVTERVSITAHSIVLTNLGKGTQYHYAIDVVDEASNLTTDDNNGECYSFTTPDTNYFTELFTSDSDLDYLSLTFTPDGSYHYYTSCAVEISKLPIDPTGGMTLNLSNNSYAAVTLSGGETVSLYGNSYGTFYVGSNGYVTFSAGDSDPTESLAHHFELPRISALFHDFDPSAGGIISWKQFADRAVVTWQDLPEYGTSDTNTFQVEMHFDGTVVMSFLSLSANDGLAGLSQGDGLPDDFSESDLSAMESCWGPSCDDDGVCETGEDCYTCSNDCLSGAGAICGNGVCEAADGEDCISCPEDCNGKLGGKPGRRYCCGDGSAQYGVTCDDSRCTDGGKNCTDFPVIPSCCGDGVCDIGEDSFNCEVDCGPAPICGGGSCDDREDQCNCPEDCGVPPADETSCTDRIDNDCDGLTDADDPDCACLPKGEPCEIDSDCCSNWCHRGICK